MEKSPIIAKSFYLGSKHGFQLVVEQFNGIIGRSECEATARDIVESCPDKESMVNFLTNMLMGIEQIKYQERTSAKTFRVSENGPELM